ncbi:hypothetical protein [Salinicola sp. CR57]|uniref:hypothetical protein n=1 Tax=Salinicola sp. CR57 TaxID=1949086 RepID=UPI0013007397|nr:hypothetical protein [Salinicola sp. CR57]
MRQNSPPETIAVECRHCLARESADSVGDITGFVLSVDGTPVHCRWCGGDTDSLFGDEP